MVGLREAFFFWLKLGGINFGGPTGQIAILRQKAVLGSAAAGLGYTLLS